MRKLVIVESPTKVKTIRKYLGQDYTVVSTSGHIRNLQKKQQAIEVDNNFQCHFELLPGKKNILRTIEENIKGADVVYIATDQDREGEGIGWHLTEHFSVLLKDKLVQRITFNEITPSAIKQALDRPCNLDHNLISAYQARVMLDFLVGFYLSPILWRKIRPRTGAGRVQGPALSLIIEREEEIKQHVQKHYWTVQGQIIDESIDIHPNTGYEKNYFTAESVAQDIVDHLNLNGTTLTINKIVKKVRSFAPPLPFNTSSLQQTAARDLGLKTKVTMHIAQQLYEGIDIGGESLGLITYPRTDSYQLSRDFKEQLRDYFMHCHPHLYHEYNHVYKKDLNAQESHEAIRPVDLWLDVMPYLTKEQAKLYTLIVQRSLMASASHREVEYVTYHASHENVEATFTIATTLKQGFTFFQQDNKKEKQIQFSVSDKINTYYFIKHHTTQPAPRYNEASLVKKLTDLGIGRPSTYAQIIDNLKLRDYVYIDKGKFFPTLLGRLINLLLKEHFAPYINYDFTAQMEKDLDTIAVGRSDLRTIITEFWKKFALYVEKASHSASFYKFIPLTPTRKCAVCQNQLVERLGKYGAFVCCIKYPKCDYVEKTRTSLGLCPRCCKGDLIRRTGRRGSFIGCSEFPNCLYTNDGAGD